MNEENLKQETPAENETVWTEEIKVAGKDLWETLKGLFHEVNVRRIVIKNEKQRVLVEIPIVLGIAGIALLPWWSTVALIAALVTDCSIMVERVGEGPETA